MTDLSKNEGCSGHFVKEEDNVSADDINLISGLDGSTLQKVKRICHEQLKKNNFIHSSGTNLPTRIISNSHVSLNYKYCLSNWKISVSFDDNLNDGTMITFYHKGSSKTLIVDIYNKEMESFNKYSESDMIQCQNIYKKIDKTIKKFLKKNQKWIGLLLPVKKIKLEPAQNTADD